MEPLFPPIIAFQGDLVAELGNPRSRVAKEYLLDLIVAVDFIYPEIGRDEGREKGIVANGDDLIEHELLPLCSSGGTDINVSNIWTGCPARPCEAGRLSGRWCAFSGAGRWSAGEACFGSGYEEKPPLFKEANGHILMIPGERLHRIGIGRFVDPAILPEPPLEDNDHDPSCQFSHDNDGYIPQNSHCYRLSFTKLLRRVFKIDLDCPRCGGKLKIISAILDVEVIHKILTHLKLSPDPPSLTPSRFSSFRMYEEMLV